jgi:hypothetical protein
VLAFGNKLVMTPVRPMTEHDGRCMLNVYKSAKDKSTLANSF